MGFVQIISFRTDRYDEFAELEQQWLEDTEGSRTVVRQQTLVDRKDPRHHVAIVEFASYESAMANSSLPETDALAQKFASMSEGTEFGDYDVVTEHDVRRQLAAALRESMASGTVLAGTLRDDVAFEGLWPGAVVRGSGPDFFEAALHEEAPSRTFERWDVTVSETGFVAEYSYRTHGEVSYLSMGAVLATIDGGRISRLVVTCGGSWDADAEQRILGATAVAS